MTAWAVEHHRGSAGELHAASAALVQRAGGRVVRMLEASRPALVLGSAQRAGEVNAEAAARLGVEVVNRRSGGGAVLTGPGEVVWIDLVLPAGDPLWDDDVRRASWWVGDTWAASLDRVGEGRARVWKGPMTRPVSRWSKALCFGGFGPGEVVVDGRKVVGVSQRRTRHGALFQTAALLRWEPGILLDLFGVDPRERSGLERRLLPLARGIGSGWDERLAEAFLAVLDRLA